MGATGLAAQKLNAANGYEEFSYDHDSMYFKVGEGVGTGLSMMLGDGEFAAAGDLEEGERAASLSEEWGLRPDASPELNIRGGAGSDLPIEGGPPDGMLVNETEPGKGTIRKYDAEGRVQTDYDFGHDYHGTGSPHAHDWIWRTAERGRGNPFRIRIPRPLGPGE